MHYAYPSFSREKDSSGAKQEQSQLGWLSSTHPTRKTERCSKQSEHPTCAEEVLNGVVELLGIGGVELDVQGFQAQVQGSSHHLLHIPRQAVQMDIQDTNELLVLLVGGHLQVVPELVDLQRANNFHLRKNPDASAGALQPLHGLLRLARLHWKSQISRECSLPAASCSSHAEE